MEPTQELLEAVKAGATSTVRELLDNHPELVQTRDSDGVSAVLLAVYYGHEALPQLFLDAGISLNIFEAAALGKMTRVVQILNQQPELVNACAVDGFTPLGLAAFFGHQTVAKILLARGADVNKPSCNKLKASPIISAVANRHLAITELLLEAGADVDASEDGGFTSLQIAAANGQAEMIKMLMNHGADRSIKNDAGKTAYEMAQEEGHKGIIELLSG